MVAAIKRSGHARLKVAPALRERHEDIALLAETLLIWLAPGRAYTSSEAGRARLWRTIIR